MSAKQHTSHAHRAPRSIRRSRWYLFLALALYGLQLTPLATGSAIGAAAQPALVKCTINYQAPFAEDVLLVWGVNNWRLPDPAVRPAGSKDDGYYAITPMQALGNHKYTTTITVTEGTLIDYAFHMTKPAETWDGEPWRQLGYHTKVNQDNQIDQYQPVVTQQIRYRMSEAGEVTLIWGINGWRPVPEPFWPAGTTFVEDKLLYTQMALTGDAFVTSVQVPAGTMIDYVFKITKLADGTVVDLADVNGNPERDYHTVAADRGSIEVRKSLAALQAPASADEPKADYYSYAFWLIVGIGGVAAVAGAVIAIIVSLRGSSYSPEQRN